MALRHSYSTSEWAGMHGVSVSNISAQCQAGSIPTGRTGKMDGHYRIPVSHLWDEMGLSDDLRVRIAVTMMDPDYRPDPIQPVKVDDQILNWI